jgi:hypothetical protein
MPHPRLRLRAGWAASVAALGAPFAAFPGLTPANFKQQADGAVLMA